jgi:ribosome-binding protein aMBF1 (putative translation factor)
MKTNLKLLTAIRKKGMRQKDFAKVVGEHETFISRVVNGWINLDEVRKAKYAKMLGCTVDDLFSGK